ncbi:Por secretion system C-terminal sorting domain-containing protein [Chryseolinea serpens]|uniref:Por secretion system C-terminal sorting domain-containing protein n=1 Tax=Chryseolinea serpens TaxID=947013 RepID=A0A1M5NGN4_9BACT|nr:T9SS type A sorting domain-containing protein [Chryseolinea serpens]SHG88617.1 Por secretion system C-terminal sorting domain-containing protein [Chryseolinea serpens]
MKLKIEIHFVLVCCLLYSFSATAQSNPSEVVRSSGGKYIDHGMAMTLDRDGNMYVTGGFQSEAQFGSMRLSSAGDTDAFIAKYNVAGEPVWVNQAGGDTVLTSSLTEYGRDILFYDDFIYVTGVFLSKARFSNIEVASQGMDDIFLAKYSLNGQLMWLKTAGGASQDIPFALSADSLGGIYLTGSFQGKAKFGNALLESKNSTEMFVVKYDTRGELLWAKQSRTDWGGSGKKIVCGGQGCIVAGEFKGVMKLDDLASASVGNRICLMKFNLDGRASWLKETSEDGHATVEDVAIYNGNLYLTGSFAGAMKYETTALYSKGQWDAYLLALDKNGHLLWSRSFGGVANDIGKSISIDKSNTLYLAGNFQQMIDIKDGPSLECKGADDIFLAQLSSDGSLLTAQGIGGVAQDQVNDVDITKDYIFLTGFFRESITIRNIEQKSNGYSDVLLTKINKNDPENMSDYDDLVKVYPIPSKGEFTVESATKISSLELMNELGQAVSNVQIHFKTENSADVKLVKTKGLYFITGYSNGKKFSRKIIVE